MLELRKCIKEIKHYWQQHTLIYTLSQIIFLYQHILSCFTFCLFLLNVTQHYLTKSFFPIGDGADHAVCVKYVLPNIFALKIKLYFENHLS